MKTKKFLEKILGFFASISFLVGFQQIYSVESSCYREIEKDFFRKDYVDEALSLHNVSQSAWTYIHQSLQESMKKVPGIVRKRAAKMDPNPFDFPFRPDVASELLRQALFEVFSTTLAPFGITNSSDLKDMFTYIRDKQSKRLIACFGDEAFGLQPLP